MQLWQIGLYLFFAALVVLVVSVAVAVFSTTHPDVRTEQLQEIARRERKALIRDRETWFQSNKRWTIALFIFLMALAGLWEVIE